jgi:O-antigen ligase
MGRFMRAYGSFRQPNPYAGYLGLVTPLALSLALWAVSRVWEGLRRGPRNLPRDMLWRCLNSAGLLAVTVLLAAGLGMSWSRGAWLGLAASSVAVCGLRSRRAAIVILLAAVVVGALVIAGGFTALPGALTERLSGFGEYIRYATSADTAHVEITDANFAVLERVAHWQAAWGMFSDYPWFGVGIGNYAVAYPRYALPRWSDPLGHAHNTFLHYLAETGLLGLAGYILWLAAAVAAAWRARGANSRFAQAVAVGAVGVVAHLVVHSLVDNLYVQGVYLHLAIVLGVVSARRSRGVEPA